MSSIDHSNGREEKGRKEETRGGSTRHCRFLRYAPTARDTDFSSSDLRRRVCRNFRRECSVGGREGRGRGSNFRTENERVKNDESRPCGCAFARARARMKSRSIYFFREKRDRSVAGGLLIIARIKRRSPLTDRRLLIACEARRSRFRHR